MSNLTNLVIFRVNKKLFIIDRKHCEGDNPAIDEWLSENNVDMYHFNGKHIEFPVGDYCELIQEGDDIEKAFKERFL